MELVDRVRKLLLERIVWEKGEVVVVAVSGGLDSLVLLDVMERISPELGIRLHLAHLDHQLRQESGEDARFVADVAASRGIAYTGASRDVRVFADREGLSIEDAARRVRYLFLDEVARREGARKIALGHHADDQAETVLLRLLRGSGARGLAAMEIFREERYLRPLLEIGRRELEAYARAADLRFRQDASNLDRRYARNRVRHELMPLLRTYNPHIVDALNRTAELLRAEDEYLDEVAKLAVQMTVRQEDVPCGSGKIILDASGLLDYHIAVQRRIVRVLLRGLSKREGPFDFGQVERVLQVAREGKTGVYQLAAGLAVQRVDERLILGRCRPSRVDETVSVPGDVVLEDYRLCLRVRLLPGEFFEEVKGSLGKRRVAFDAERLGERLRLRHAVQGERFQPLGMKGRKKLSDFLIDEKWPRLLRDGLLLLARPDGEIAWVVGMRIGHPFRVHSQSREIALVELAAR